MHSAKHSVFRRSLGLFGLTTALAAGVPVLLDGAARLGALTGVVAGTLASATALGLLALAFDRPVKLLLGALVVGFLLRMLVVGAGILIAVHLGGEPLAFVAAFFGLYLVHQAIELTVVVRRTRTVSAEGQA
jgi:hypothetical protein